MGTYTDGVYVPAIGEVGWAEELNDFLTRSGEEYVNVKAAPFGALGDDSTDDSAAIQAAIDTGAGTVYFPPVTGSYRIGTPLVPVTGQQYLGGGNVVNEYGGSAKASRLKCKSPNTVMWDCSENNGAVRNTWRNLVFQDNASAWTDTCFQGGDNGGFGGCYWIGCNWYYFKWAIDQSDNGAVVSAQFTTNWFIGCEFGAGSPLRLNGGYANNNHWTECSFHVNQLAVPMIDIHAGNAPQGISFDSCYAESLSRQFLRIYGTQALKITNSYFEAVNSSNTTYVAADGRTLMLPSVDLCNDVDTQGGSTNIELGGNFWGIANATVGSTDRYGTPGTRARITDPPGGPFDNSLYPNYDLSMFTEIEGQLVDMASFANAFDSYPPGFNARNASWTNGIMPWLDAYFSKTWYLKCHSGASTLTIPAPMSAAQGRTLTFIIDNSDSNFGAITWNAAFVFTGGAWTGPANGKRKTIVFQYMMPTAGAGFPTAQWVELYRSGDYT